MLSLQWKWFGAPNSKLFDSSFFFLFFLNESYHENEENTSDHEAHVNELYYWNLSRRKNRLRTEDIIRITYEQLASLCFSLLFDRMLKYGNCLTADWMPPLVLLDANDHIRIPLLIQFHCRNFSSVWNLKSDYIIEIRLSFTILN